MTTENDGKINPGYTNANAGALNSERNARYNELQARKKGVTKGAFIAAIISFILLVTAGVVVYSIYTREHKKQLAMMENQRVLFTEQLTTRDQEINDWVLAFDQIEKNLSEIKQKESMLTVKSAGAEFSKDRKQQILEDIKEINSLLDQNKKKIASLSAQLNKSGGTIKALQGKIVELEASMKQREDEISNLKTALVTKDFEIGQLNTRVSGMEVAIAQKDETISNQTDEMNKGFLAYGTYKELKAKGLVLKEGGFIGLGRKESLLENFSDNSFAQINITELNMIPVNSKSAKLITEHPANSYELIHDNTNKNKIAYIEIKDRDQFWKISKYAVVEIIK